MGFVGVPVHKDSQIQTFYFQCTFYVYMPTALHIKVIIQLKTVKSRPILIPNIHKNNFKGLNGLLEVSTAL